MLKGLAAAGLLAAMPFVAGAGTLAVPRTGQTGCFSATGVVVPCAGTGQDGEKQAGAPWPAPRFADNGDGSVTDRLTGLVWLRDADCRETVGGVARGSGLLDWPAALAWSNGLAHGRCGLSDNSAAGDWRVPNVNELRSLVDYGRHDPALPAGHPFVNVRSVWYWTSTTNPVYTGGAYNVGFSRGSIHVTGKVRPVTGGASRVESKIDSALGVWPVRDGR